MSAGWNVRKDGAEGIRSEFGSIRLVHADVCVIELHKVAIATRSGEFGEREESRADRSGHESGHRSSLHAGGLNETTGPNL
jgi:hypothetical protein